MGALAPLLDDHQRPRQVVPLDAVVELVESEPAVQAMERLGLVALCSPGGSSFSTEAGWLPFAALFRGRTVRLWPDSTESGRLRMRAAAGAIAPAAAELRFVRIRDRPKSASLAQHLKQRPTAAAEPLESVEISEPFIPGGRYRLSEFLHQDIPGARWAIEGILPDGLTIFAGKLKMGKSLAMLTQSLAIASGGQAFGAIPVEQGDVLYIALEDAERLLQDRARALLGSGLAPERMDLWTSCPRIDEGGLDDIESWLQKHPDARLVVVDTLARIRSRTGRAAGTYSQDYDSVAPLADLSHRRRVAIVLIHHLRKQRAQDPLDMLSGTTGLAAGVDGVLILERSRGDVDAQLHVIIRAGDERRLALRFDSAETSWSLLGDAGEYLMSNERRAILDLLAPGDSLTPKEIAEALDRPRSTIRRLVSQMASSGDLTRTGSRYSV